jgi:hypothetical protein
LQNIYNILLIQEQTKLFSLGNSPSVVILLTIYALLMGFLLQNSQNIYFKHLVNLFVIQKTSQIKPLQISSDIVGKILFWISIIGLSFFIVLAYDFYTNISNNPQIIDFDKRNEFVLSFFAKILITFIVLIAYLYLKKWFFDFIGNVFNLNKYYVVLCRNAYFLIMSFLGFFMFSLSFFYLYLPPNCQYFPMIFGFILMGFSAIFYCYFCLKIFFEGVTSLFYFFLYLCTLEILPVLVLRKALIWAYEFV